MSLFLSLQGFAIYSMGARQIPFISMIGVSVSNVLIPHLVEDVQAGRYSQICWRWRLACERTAITTYLIAAFCIWHASPVVQFLFSALYAESSVPFRVFAALTFLRVVEFQGLAKAFGRTDLIMKSAFLNAGALAVFAIPLAWGLGILGMALAVFLAVFTTLAYYLRAYRKLLGEPISTFFPWPRLLLLLCIAFASTGLSSWLLGPALTRGADTSMLTLGWRLGGLFALSGGFYVALLVFCGFLQPKALFKKYLGRGPG
jgi:O-antigen/teichoic acid export membrane protein